jgi:hypothetical protein
MAAQAKRPLGAVSNADTVDPWLPPSFAVALSRSARLCAPPMVADARSRRLQEKNRRATVVSPMSLGVASRKESPSAFRTDDPRGASPSLPGR